MTDFFFFALDLRKDVIPPDLEMLESYDLTGVREDSGILPTDK